MRQSVKKEAILASLQRSSKRTTIYVYAFDSRWDTAKARRAAIDTPGVKWLGGGRIRCEDTYALCLFKEELSCPNGNCRGVGISTRPYAYLAPFYSGTRFT